MSIKIKGILFILAVFAASIRLSGQNTDALGTYTPYSLFGIGDIAKQGTSFNRGMGGIGIGVRDNRFINYVNPASITARDTLSFMLDFGLNQQNFYNSNGDANSAYNTFNMQNIIFTAPIYKKSALIVGITPYSNVGYKFNAVENDPVLVSKYGDIQYQKYGEGSIYQFFVGGAMNLFKNLSIGAQYTYYFGSLDKNSNIYFGTSTTVRNIINRWDYSVSAHSAQVGLQYFTNVGNKMEFTAGATYRLKTKLKGDLKREVMASDNSNLNDTIIISTIKDPNLSIPTEIGFGVSLRKKDKWLIGADFSRQMWSHSDLPEYNGVNFKPVAANSFNVGFEYIPNKYDIKSYMKRATYRIGAYYEESYVKLNNKQVNAFGVTVGASLPIHKWYNSANFSLDFGQRGSVKDNLVRERYVKFTINISLHDIWFVKYRYQ